MPVDTVIRCPKCGHEEPEFVPDDGLILEYECEGCHAVLRPREGECCVICSYGRGQCQSR